MNGMKCGKLLERLARGTFVGALIATWTSVGATLVIPKRPIFLANDVQANIFFALDDSGSMNWEVLKSDAATKIHTAAPNSGSLDYSPNDTTEDREWCVEYNVLAYNPSVTYTPWTGVDEAGNAYTDQSISAALVDPYDADGSTRNLLNADSTGYAVGYGLWVDGDGSNPADGEYQDGECPTLPSSGSGYTTRAAAVTDPRWIFVDTLSATEQTNFANWYSYYRKREYVLKRAVSDLVQSSDQRMGLATLHNNNSVGTPVTDMQQQANKDALLKELFRIDSSGLTPLRALLRNTGRYFDQTDSLSHAALGFSNASPILDAARGGECQQNFAILFSDGYWNGSSPSVGNMDGDNSSAWDGGPHADNYHDTLADVAMKYYEKDLSSLADKVPVIPNVDDNDAQHLVTYAVSFGLKGTLTTVPADHDPATPPPPWPLPTANAATTTDDMWHAAFNARGLFLSGQNPQQLIDTMAAALAEISSRSGSASAVAATSQSVQVGTLLFQGRFDTDNWHGDLHAIEFLTDGSFGSTVWKAAEHIPAAAGRNIVTWVNNGTVTGAEFQWGNLTAAQQSQVGSQKVLNYIRGDRSGEQKNGGTLRDRTSLLGDIIYSSPIGVTKHVAKPPYAFFPGAEGGSYPAYLRARDATQGVVFVGANDGMLHGFDTASGAEVFAYVPQAVFPKLASLSDPNYQHDFYVDGALASADAYVSGSWKRMLVGSLGRGGRVVFALDVSTPGSMDESDVEWEMTHAELGLVLGRIQIVRLRDGKWYAVTGNGYNSTSERAQLFFIDLADGSVDKVIDTGVGSSAAPNGLSTPALVDTNYDFIYDYAYAGDLQGNLWKFDLTGNTASSWSLALSGTPLYTALDTDGNPQAITARPTIIPHSDSGYIALFGSGRYFADGDNIVPAANAPVDTFYAIRDSGNPVPSVGSRAAPGSGSQPATVLQPQEIVSVDNVTYSNGSTSHTETVRTVSTNAVNYVSQHGWYFDLVEPAHGRKGERVITTAFAWLLNDVPIVRFGTFEPVPGCETATGVTWVYTLNAESGSELGFATADINGDGIVDAADGGTDSSGNVHYAGGRRGFGPVIADFGFFGTADGKHGHVVGSSLDGGVESEKLLINSVTLGRQSWRQIE